MPHCVDPLTVAYNSHKLRLVLDLRNVNKFDRLHKLKYEDLRTLPMMFHKGDYFFTFDITSAYHHVSIHADFVQYLGFQRTDCSGEIHSYVLLLASTSRAIRLHLASSTRF